MKSKKIGLALGSGIAKGFAHVGVLEALEKNDIKVDYIAGTSMGAVVGALYASGMKVDEIRKVIKNIKWEELVDFTLPGKGILSGKKIEIFLRELLKGKTFRKLKIPLRIVATDIVNGEKIIFKSGDVASAVRASISLPGIFVPYRHGGKIYVDGGVVDPVPVNVVRSMGADIVIGVDLSTELRQVVLSSGKYKVPKFLGKLKQIMIKQEIQLLREEYVKKRKYVLLKPLLNNYDKIAGLFKKKKIKSPEMLRVSFNSINIMINELSRFAASSADFIVKPDLRGISVFDFDKSLEIAERGKKATNSIVREIKNFIKA